MVVGERKGREIEGDFNWFEQWSSSLRFNGGTTNKTKLKYFLYKKKEIKSRVGFKGAVF